MPAVEDVLAKYDVLFEKGYGLIKQYKASIQVREGAQPIFLKARPVPYALKEKVEQELQRLEDEGIIMDQLLQGVKFTACRLDDILVSGGSPEEHFAILEEVFGAFSSSQDSSFLDTGLTKTAFVPSLRRWMQSWKPRIPPMSRS